MRLKFALFSGSAPEWMPAELVGQLVAQGWDGVEWRVADQAPAPTPQFFAGNLATFPQTGILEHIPQIVAITHCAGLGQPALFSGVPLGDEALLADMLAAAAAAGTSMLRITVPKTAPDRHYDEQFGETRRHAESAIALARRAGVKPLIQLHHGNVISTPSSARRLLEGLDPEWIGVIHDLGNLSIEGREGLASHVPGLQVLGPYLAHVHIKNIAWQAGKPAADGTVDWTWSWAPLASGFADVKGYFKALATVGYAGWVTVENFTDAPPLEARLAGDLAYLKAAARAAGYAI